MEFLILAVLIGLLPAAIASSKGGNFVLWWLFGFLLFIVALPCALLMKQDQASLDRRALSSGSKKCPHCAEIIRSDANVCRYCGRDLPPAPAPGLVQAPALPASYSQAPKKGSKPFDFG